MKKIRHFLSILLAVCMLVSASGVMTVNAADISDSNSTTITKFSYTVFDQNGNIVECGLTPDFRTRASWSGITLENGYGVALMKEDGSGFYATSGTTMSFTYNLNRAARMEHTIGFAENPTGDPGWAIWRTLESQAQSGGLTAITRETGYQMFFMTNISSDPVTITSATLVF